MLATFVGVYRVPLEGIEIFAGFADIPGPGSFHVEKCRTCLAGKLLKAFAIIAEKPDLMNTITVKVWTEAGISNSPGSTNLVFSINPQESCLGIENS
ncbi:MAG: hypothetical protein ACYSWP_21410 [Planctomycetota bacterium]